MDIEPGLIEEIRSRFAHIDGVVRIKGEVLGRAIAAKFKQPGAAIKPVQLPASV